jgi:hypothetical protein
MIVAAASFFFPFYCYFFHCYRILFLTTTGSKITAKEQDQKFTTIITFWMLDGIPD